MACAPTAIGKTNVVAIFEPEVCQDEQRSLWSSWGMHFDSFNPEPTKKTGGTVRILIADDHPMVRDSLKKLLALESDFEIVGEVGDGREVLHKVRQIDPDILLLDLRMPDLDGLAILETLQRSNSRTRVIVLTASEDKDVLVQAVKQRGGWGVLLKHSDPDLIVESIRKVNAGQGWLD
jgi:DNA-binding NarL/FixJ family response regulator